MGLSAIILGVLGLIAGVLGSTGSILGTRKNNSIAAAENYEYGEQAAENAQQRQIETYQSLYSLPAQMEQINSAGLSPGLIYSGTGGASGSTPAAPQGEGAGGQQGKYFDLMAHNEMAQMASQIAVNESIARKNNAEAEVTEETGLDTAHANIENIFANTGLTNLQAEGQKLDNAFQDMQNAITEASQEDQVATIKANRELVEKSADKMNEDVKAAKIDNKTREQYNKAIIRQINGNCELMAQQVIESQANIKINTEKLHQEYQRLCLEAERNDIMRFTAEEQNNWWDKQIEIMLENVGIGKDQLKLEKRGQNMRAIVDGVKSVVGMSLWAYGKFGANPTAAAAGGGLKSAMDIKNTAPSVSMSRPATMGLFTM